MGKITIKDVTFLFAVRIDSLERFENIKTVIEYIFTYFETNIIVLEADSKNSSLLKKYLPQQTNIIFVEDFDNTYHRTKYINILTRESSTPIIAVWDTDVVVNYKQILAAVLKLRDNSYDFAFPYDGRFVETGVDFRNQFINDQNIEPLERSTDNMFTPYTAIACGGGFLAVKKSYIEAGMENENFRSWGPEDGERVRRWRILNMRIIRVKGPMFHLFHPRGINSTFKSEQDRLLLINEFERISRMSKFELGIEIRTWKWCNDML